MTDREKKLAQYLGIAGVIIIILLLLWAWLKRPQGVGGDVILGDVSVGGLTLENADWPDLIWSYTAPTSPDQPSGCGCGCEANGELQGMVNEMAQYFVDQAQDIQAAYAASVMGSLPPFFNQYLNNAGGFTSSQSAAATFGGM